jgi:putative copper export protein
MNAVEALAIARLVHFASVMVLFGAWLFPLYAVAPEGGTANQRGSLPRSFYTAAAIVAVASGLAWMVWSFVDITGSSANFFDGEILSVFFLGTEFGRAWVVRLFLLGLLAFVAIWRRKEIRLEYCAAIASLLLASQAWLGHAVAGLRMSGAWIGGLFPLGVWLVSTRNGTSEDLTSAVLALDRFSVMGMVAVPLIVVSGFLNVAFREAGRNLEVMWLTGRLAPDHKTIADFRKDNGPAIKKVCAQFVELCRKMGLLAKASVAIDGSKFKAVNSRDNNFTKGKLERRLKQIEESVARYMSHSTPPTVARRLAKIRLRRCC